MIIFDKISYKNILSVGQAPLTLSLSSCRLTALYGVSGSGKSLFLDALSFVLFGRAFRDINKGDLINSINGKGLEVDVHFSIGEKRYQIIRGLKPNIFKIFINGELLNQEAHVKDQQKYLEDQILKMTWKMFTQVVMLGAANYTPFLRLKPSDRKKMVESILGIDVFTTMNTVIKGKIADRTTMYKGYIEKRETLTKQVEYLVKQQVEFEVRQKREIDALITKLKSLKEQKDELERSIADKEVSLAMAIEAFDPCATATPFTEVFNEEFLEEFMETFTDEFIEVGDDVFDVTHLVAQKSTIESEIKSTQARLAAISKDLAFYAEHATCPTCSQSINEEFSCNAIQSLEIEQETLTLKSTELNTQLRQIIVDARGIQARKQEYLQAKTAHNAKKQVFERNLKAFEARRRSYDERLRAFEGRRREHEEKVRKLAEVVEQKRKEFDVKVDKARTQIAGLKGQVSSIITEAKFVKESIDEKKSYPLLDNSEEIQNIQEQVDALATNIDDSANTLKTLREVQAIIRDDGVKSELLKRYVPTLNKYINIYLEKMNMFVSFELDSEFNDKIKSRHRDILSYGNFSEGERQRIDLAVLLAWRHLAQSQSAINTNLLILDEVLDSYLDQATTEMILSLLRSDEFSGFNVFVISHKDGLLEHFDQTIQFAKKNNFTSMS